MVMPLVQEASISPRDLKIADKLMMALSRKNRTDPPTLDDPLTKVITSVQL